MGLLLASATSDSPSVTPLWTAGTPPFTVGCWVRPDATTGLYVWNYSDPTIGIGVIGGAAVFLRANTDWNLTISEDASIDSAATTTDVVAGSWYFIIARVISNTNRRLAVLNNDTGLIQHAQNTTSKSIANATTLYLNTLIDSENGGATSFSNQVIAEFWYTATDIQADGAQLDDYLLRQLAYGGPFSVPYIGYDVLEYHSLRSSLLTMPVRGETYARSGTAPVWAGAGITTVHPSLPYWYQAPPADTLNVSMMMF